MRFDSGQPAPMLALAARIVHAFFVLGGRARRAVKGCATVRRFASRGDSFVFDPDGTYSYESIHVGNHVNLGAGATLLATRSEIKIGNHVMFGPGVTIRGGNHRFDVIGRYIDSIRDDEKRTVDDPGVVIEDDVWIGGNATILGGVTVGRGSVVGASSVVTRSVAAYKVVGGNPAKVLQDRYTPDQIAAHELGTGQEHT